MSGSPLVFDWDFTNLIISGKTAGTFEAENDFYSDWKELVAENAGGIAAGAPPAFDVSIGGNPIGLTDQVAPYFFFRNDLGWRFRPAELHGETFIDGNFFPSNPNIAQIVPTVGAYTHLVRLLVSSRATVVETGTSGLTPTESQQLADIDATTISMDATLDSVETIVGDMDMTLDSMSIVLTSVDGTVTAMDLTLTSLRKLLMNKMITDPVTGILTIFDDDDTTPLFSGNIYEDALAAQIYRGRGLERRERLT